MNFDIGDLIIWANDKDNPRTSLIVHQQETNDSGLLYTTFSVTKSDGAYDKVYYGELLDCVELGYCKVIPVKK